MGFSASYPNPEDEMRTRLTVVGVGINDAVPTNVTGILASMYYGKLFLLE